jgi:hypothetical protein
LFPLCVRQTIPVPVGTGVFAAVIEESNVVVLVLYRLDYVFDELIKFVK